MHSQPGLDLDVEVLVDGDWVRSRAYESRRGVNGRETLVSWPTSDGVEPAVRGAWVNHRHLRAIHVGE